MPMGDLSQQRRPRRPHPGRLLRQGALPGDRPQAPRRPLRDRPRLPRRLRPLPSPLPRLGVDALAGRGRPADEGPLLHRRDEYVCMNVAQGGGKTRFFHDFSAWITAHDRTLRGIQGSLGLTVSVALTANLRDTLSRTVPVQPRDIMLQRGMAIAARPPWPRTTAPSSPPPMKPTCGAATSSPSPSTAASPPPTRNPPGPPSPTRPSSCPGGSTSASGTTSSTPGCSATPTPSKPCAAGGTTKPNPGSTPAGSCPVVGQRLRSNDIYRYVLDKAATDEIEATTSHDEDAPPCTSTSSTRPTTTSCAATSTAATPPPTWRAAACSTPSGSPGRRSGPSRTPATSRSSTSRRTPTRPTCWSPHLDRRRQDVRHGLRIRLGRGPARRRAAHPSPRRVLRVCAT